MNTDIHRSRTGLGHRVGATERRPRCVRCSGPQQRPAARHRAADPACRSLRHPTRPRPRAATRRPDPRPRLHRRHRAEPEVPISTVTTAEQPVPSLRAASARAALLVVGMGGADRSAARRHRIDRAGGQRAASCPGHRRPRTPSPARHEPADPGRRRQRDDQRGRAELRVRRRPPARRSGRRDQRDLEHPQRPRHTCPETPGDRVFLAGGVRRHPAHERSCGSSRTGALAYRCELTGRAEHDEDRVCLDRCVRVGVGEERAVGAAQGEQQCSGGVADRRVVQGSAQ